MRVWGFWVFGLRVEGLGRKDRGANVDPTGSFAGEWTIAGNSQKEEELSQRTQYPLMREHTLNCRGLTIMI